VSPITTVPIGQIKFIKELYPRIREDDATIERYRAAIDLLPPITTACDGVLVDGFHRWTAHKREGKREIATEDLGKLTDAEIIRESIKRNAAHGYQPSQADKKRLAGQLWLKHLAALPWGERTTEIMTLLSVTDRAVQLWTKDARQTEKEALQARTWDLWLNCLSEREIADQVGVVYETAGNWVAKKRKDSEFSQPPGCESPDPKNPKYWGRVQHFDAWQFQNGGDGSYFGRRVFKRLANTWRTPACRHCGLAAVPCDCRCQLAAARQHRRRYLPEQVSSPAPGQLEARLRVAAEDKFQNRLATRFWRRRQNANCLPTGGPVVGIIISATPHHRPVHCPRSAAAARPVTLASAPTFISFLKRCASPALLPLRPRSGEPAR
jgi:hypothetical protein